MPYHSEAQRRWAHTPTGKRALGGNAAVHEWDTATKGKKLPEKVEKAAAAAGVGNAVSTFGGFKAMKPPQGIQPPAQVKLPTPTSTLHQQNISDSIGMDTARTQQGSADKTTN